MLNQKVNELYLCRMIPLFYFAISTPPVAPASVSEYPQAAADPRLTKEFLYVTVDSKLSCGLRVYLCQYDFFTVAS